MRRLGAMAYLTPDAPVIPRQALGPDVVVALFAILAARELHRSRRDGIDSGRPVVTVLPEGRRDEDGPHRDEGHDRDREHRSQSGNLWGQPHRHRTASLPHRTNAVKKPGLQGARMLNEPSVNAR